MGRLVRAASVLAQHRALIPEPMWKTLPPAYRAGEWLLAGGRRVALPQGDAKGARAHGQRLAQALERLGPSYIKFGQLLATRADLLGADVTAGMSDLHDKLPPFPDAEAHATLEAELGRPAHTLFDALSPALAAASIAQVHKAEITENGETRFAAVKVLRPGIETAFRRDLDTLYTGAHLALRFRPDLKRLRPLDVVRTLDDSVRQEMDLRIEAASASEMAANTAQDPEFRVPAVDWQRTSRRVLTSEWIDGIPLSDRDRLEESGIDRGRLARIVLQSFLRHAMRDGFFHADMHPGNLFVDEQERLVAVDFGIMGRLDRGTRHFMAETLYGFITRDYERVADVHFEAGYVPRHHARSEFALALRAVGEPIWGRPAREMSIGRLLTQLFETTQRFDMALQPSLLMLQKTMVTAEGVARDLDDTLSIWECARPVLEEWMAAELGPEARLREAADAARSVGRLASRAPELVRELETASHALSGLAEGGGLRLHPETMRSLTTRRSVSADRWIIWVLIGLNVALFTLLAMQVL